MERTIWMVPKEFCKSKKDLQKEVIKLFSNIPNDGISKMYEGFPEPEPTKKWLDEDAKHERAVLFRSKCIWTETKIQTQLRKGVKLTPVSPVKQSDRDYTFPPSKMDYCVRRIGICPQIMCRHALIVLSDDIKNALLSRKRRCKQSTAPSTTSSALCKPTNTKQMKFVA